MARLTTSVQTPNSGREVWCVAASLAHRRSMFVGVLPSTDFDVSYYWISLLDPPRARMLYEYAGWHEEDEHQRPQRQRQPRSQQALVSSFQLPPTAAAGPQLHSISGHGGNRAPLGEERERGGSKMHGDPGEARRRPGSRPKMHAPRTEATLT
ncbi:uncharacterized protein CLUP02_03348 [Colletotrichum lupini]|uniref:Uncharacterized protein n=1 Tax=Colletotrichum lupini TaxID=145971 RepID=A0A9Q8SJ65_9PEZI|nr:uncharacterized protein CLUP02_03348 [Colletotrichum lupini]UQC77876.1 hypothetical protein CLUP02_03348 [Colletotrichum lupini]